MISFDEFLKQDESDKYNILQECNAYIKSKDKEIERLKSLWETDEQSWNELMVEKETEIERLNNIINELLKYIEEKADENDDNTMISKSFKFALYDIAGKLQELKGSVKE